MSGNVTRKRDICLDHATGVLLSCTMDVIYLIKFSERLKTSWYENWKELASMIALICAGLLRTGTWHASMPSILYSVRDSLKGVVFGAQKRQNCIRLAERDWFTVCFACRTALRTGSWLFACLEAVNTNHSLGYWSIGRVQYLRPTQMLSAV